MQHKLALWALLLGSVHGCAQTTTTMVDLAKQGKNVDFADFPYTRPVKVGSSLPATCFMGDLFFNSAVSPGSNLYGCTADNTWTVLSGGNGSGGASPAVTLSAASLSFGNQTIGTTSTGKTITLQNTGTSYLAVSGMTISGVNAGDFLLSGTCGATVASGASCSVVVSFKPTVVADETASILISGNQPASPSTVSLSGTGTAAVTSGGLTLTPSATSAGANGVVSFTANRPVNWSLATGSSGTLSNNSSTSATFIAPSSIKAQDVMGGCMVMPNDTVWNTRIDQLPLESHSAAWVNGGMGSLAIGFLPGWGTNIADSSTPLQNMLFYYTPGYNGSFVSPQWPALKREGGTFGTRLNDTDHHTVTVQKDNCQFYEIYNSWFISGWCRDGKTQGCNAQSGLTYGWNTYALPSGGSTDAAGLPLAPLTLRLAEIKAGAINHAMRFTIAGGYIQNSPYWPANSYNGGCGGCVNNPPYGARFRLKASYDISKFSPTAQVILTALKQYGMFLADAGTGPTVATDTDINEDATAAGALREIAGAAIATSNLEAVDESSLMVSKTSAQVNPNNGYQTPATFAVVTATDQTNPNYQASFPVVLQSVTVGVSSPTMYILAGVSGYQMKSWVNGSSNKNTTWSLVSGVGSITAGGQYTAPASVSTAAKAVLQVASAADPTATASVYVTVLPASTNPAGGLRIDSGSGTTSTDSAGNVWQADQGLETGAIAALGGDYPNWNSLNNSSERAIYQSSFHTYGDDIVYRFIVPNGNYKVRVMLGQPFNGCPNCATFNPTWHAPLHIEANGQIALHNYDFGLPINYAYATPQDVFVPAKVTDNNLYVALRVNQPDIPTQNHPSPIIDGLQIIPDGATPYLAIDSQQKTNVAAGSSLQLYATGWYMSNAVTWSMSGPGSIDANGLYTAPASAPLSAQTATVTATSTASPNVSATITLTIPASGS